MLALLQQVPAELGGVARTAPASARGYAPRPRSRPGRGTSRGRAARARTRSARARGRSTRTGGAGRCRRARVRARGRGPARSAFSSVAASGSTGAIWSITSTRPPMRVTRDSSATASSGRGDVVQRPQRAGEVEGAELEGQLGRVALDEGDVRELLCRACAPCSSSSGTRSTATTSRTCGASAKASAPAPVPESSTRSSPVGCDEAERPSPRARPPARPGARRPAQPSSPNRSRVASCIVERLLLRGDRTRRPLLLDLGEQAADLRARRQAELLAADERLGRLGAARLLDGVRELVGAEEGKRVERPRLGRAAEAVDRARARPRAARRRGARARSGAARSRPGSARGSRRRPPRAGSPASRPGRAARRAVRRAARAGRARRAAGSRRGERRRSSCEDPLAGRAA